jgi:hypothetical protein
MYGYVERKTHFRIALGKWGSTMESLGLNILGKNVLQYWRSYNEGARHGK